MPSRRRGADTNPEKLYGGWLRDLERITKEVYATNHYRQLWRELANITRNAELPSSIFFDALGVWYAATQTTAVRRQVDRTHGVVSLLRLLDSIRLNVQLLTRERHVALWLGEDNSERDVVVIDEDWSWTPFESEAQENLDRFSGGRESDVVSREIVAEDVKRLEEVGRVIKRHVDQVVAHTSLSRQAVVPTYDELNAAIDVVAELVNKYTSLLKAETIAFFEPKIQSDWTAIFRVPWISASAPRAQ